MHKVYIALLTAVLAGTAGAQMVATATPVPPPSGQVSDPLLAGTEQFSKGAKEVTEVNMDGKSLGMMGNSSGLGDVAKKMDFVVVHTYEYDHAGMYRQQDVDAVVARLHDGSWSCMIHTRSATDSADICMRQGADHESSEMVVVTTEPKEVTFIHLKGRVSLADLEKLGSSVGAGPGSLGTPAPPVPPLTKR